jgi:L-ribulose-5-phosphate 4-epimerase
MMSHEIQQLREQVCQANLDLVAHGLVTLTWGNASALAADRSVLVIKPSGVAYDELRPEHMVVVSTETGEAVEGKLKPSSDTATHVLLYLQLKGIGGIVHTHSPRATSFAQAGRAIPCLGTTHADHFHGEVPVTRALTQAEVETAYELKTGEVIVERFASLDPVAMPAVLVFGHAPFTWGRDVADAVKNAVALEAVADIALATLSLQPSAKPLDAFLLDKHYRRKHGKDAYYGQP